MGFKKLTLDCIETLAPFFEDNSCRICDCTVGGTFMWRDYHRTEYMVDGDILYLKVDHPTPAFAPPRGKAVGREPYERILEHCGASGIAPLLCAVSKSTLARILEMFPDSRAWSDRAWSDYLYLSEDIINLAGRKFSGQRNHINRFMREYPDWSFESINQENSARAREFVEKFAQEYDRISPTYVEASQKVLEVLDNPELYKQFGGMLCVKGAIVGISLGEKVEDTLFVHAEKADTAYHGSYPMLMNQFARMFALNRAAYINREEDDGIEGLRTSKLSYHPAALLDKYMVMLK